jgi:hypothetical protein
VDINSISQDANRFTFGLEKTFWGGIGSVEFRAPITESLDAAQAVGDVDTTGAEFGNLSMNLKLLAYENGGLAVGGGLGIVFPTAEDAVIIDGVGTAVGSIANESFHLQPFLGVYHRPNNRLFHQFVSQVSFDVSGSYMTVTDPSFFGASGADRITGQSLLFMDYSLGYWIYRARCCDAIVTGIAPMIELHYTSTLDPLDIPDIDASVFEDDFRRDILNMTGGLVFQLGRYTTLRAAGVAPMRDGTDPLFDAEFGLQLNHRY